MYSPCIFENRENPEGGSDDRKKRGGILFPNDLRGFYFLNTVKITHQSTRGQMCVKIISFF